MHASHFPDRVPFRRRRCERGAGVVEYALLIALIAIALFTAVTALGDAGSESLDRSATSITSAAP
jgi:Flp pilus assembly pilin Flp